MSDRSFDPAATILPPHSHYDFPKTPPHRYYDSAWFYATSGPAASTFWAFRSVQKRGQVQLLTRGRLFGTLLPCSGQHELRREGMVYHVINRGVGKQPLFFSDDDYDAFERAIVETLEKRAMRILSYCVMPNHWHFVLWPENELHIFRTSAPSELVSVAKTKSAFFLPKWRSQYGIQP